MISDEEFSRHAMAYLKDQKKMPYDETLVHRILPVYKDNIERFEQLGDRLEILADDFSYEDQALIASQETREVLKAALEVLPSVSAEGEAIYKAFVDALKPKVKVKGKGLFHPLRMALTGKINGPELKRIFPVFGKAGVQKRLERALKA